MDKILFDEWKKMEMRVGLILEVERVPDTDKLYKLQIDIGEAGRRQIVSGLVPFYKEEELKGKKVVVLANLKPAKFKGVESNGMLLCAENEIEGTCVLLSVDKDIKIGSLVT